MSLSATTMKHSNDLLGSITRWTAAVAAILAVALAALLLNNLRSSYLPAQISVERIAQDKSKDFETISSAITQESSHPNERSNSLVLQRESGINGAVVPDQIARSGCER